VFSSRHGTVTIVIAIANVFIGFSKSVVSKETITKLLFASSYYFNSLPYCFGVILLYIFMSIVLNIYKNFKE